jgi:hypothetical protein
MSWTAPVLPKKTRDWLAALKKVLAVSLPDLYQQARFYERECDLVYGTTVRPSGSVSRTQRIPVNDSTAFTVANPESPREGVEITLDFHNIGAGTIGDVTFGSEYELDGAFVKPAVDQHATYTFVRLP